MIRDDGWLSHCIWEHSTSVHDLYRRRCRKEEDEMTAHAQAAELLVPMAKAGDVLLDAGCGSGYFFHSLASRNMGLSYFGIDAAPSLIEIGREEMPAFGLPADRLRVIRIEDLDGSVDHVVCINVLSNIDNYHRPLDRLLRMARKSLILRESLKNGAEYKWVKDSYLDAGVDLGVHVNHYDLADVLSFISDRGFDARAVVDRRSGGKPELVIGHPHYWAFVVAERRQLSDR
ncbi:MAG TPA: class I SAM-dependent methyltransferase [Pseudolabrys sp.]|nr:class I SAM-dependent methyltransferase [Pseudolabrys sp.]